MTKDERWDLLTVTTLLAVLLACGGSRTIESWFPLTPAAKTATGPRVQLGMGVFKVPNACLCPARQYGGGDESRNLGGADEARKTGGADEARKLGGADEARKTGGDDEARKTGGDDEARKHGGADEARKTGGDDEARRLGGDDESRRMGAGGEIRECNPAPDCDHINVKGIGFVPLLP